MPPVPLPAVPCVRVRLIYNVNTNLDAGNRFYLSYEGTAPSGATCTTLAADIASAWSTDIAPLVSENSALGEVDVLDIATDSGLSGQWSGDNNGSRSGDFLPDSVAANVEFGIARRYRGGKPRMYLPAGVFTDLHDKSSWSSDFVGELNAGTAAFFAAIEALSVGTLGTLDHVNLSYYKGFTNFTTPSGRERAVPTYRATALVDPIESYIAKTVIGSQRRRRTSTTP